MQLDNVDLEQLPFDIVNFLNELHCIYTAEELKPDFHNWWRGDHIRVYNHQTRSEIMQLSDTIDSQKALSLWDAAMTTQWNRTPVWIHGDMASGNILLHDGKLFAVIDFGGMAIGNPACDRVIAWTLFNASSRKFLKKL